MGIPRAIRACGAIALTLVAAAACDEGGGEADDGGLEAEVDSGGDADVAVDAADAEDGGDDDGGPEGIAWSACPLYPDDPEGPEAECATVEMPLRWDEPDGPRIGVFALRYGDPDETNGQLWILPGGPGQPVADVAEVLEWQYGHLPGWRFYAVDHRGTGNSGRLGCPEQEAAGSASGAWIVEEEWPACIEHLRAEWGDDLAEFGTTAAARDVGRLIELARPPGTRLVVTGTSYGTWWVQRYLQLFGDQPDAVMLDSINLPVPHDWEVYDRGFDAVGRALMAECAADAFCSGKLGSDPWALYVELLDRLETGHCEFFESVLEGRSRETFEYVMGSLLHWWPTRLLVAPTIYRLDRCNDYDITAVYRLLSRLLGSGGIDLGSGFSYVLSQHIIVSEMMADPPPDMATLEAMEAGTHMRLGGATGWRALWDIWPRYPHDEHVESWPESDVPMLMLQGVMDTMTPIAQAEPVGAHFSAAGQHWFLLPRVGHFALGQSPVLTDGAPPCGMQILQEFLADPPTRPAAACLDDIRPIGFDGAEFPELAPTYFGMTDLWENP